MTLDNLINNLEKVRNQVGGSCEVIVDSEDWVVTTHQITAVIDAVNDRNVVIINVNK